MPAIAVTSKRLSRASRRAYYLAKFSSGVMRSLCILCTGVILFLLFAVLIYLLIKGVHYISLDFFTKEPIPPGMADAPGGMKHAVVGTAILIGLASLVGVPLGMLTGIFLSEYSADSWLAAPTRFICDVLTGVPSIVVGILGYELL